MYIQLFAKGKINHTNTGATTLKMRREMDSLGTREVPSSAYYGIQTQRAIDNFPSAVIARTLNWFGRLG